MERSQRENTIKAIDNALVVLSYLSTENEGARITDISRELGFNVTTIHRILKTMNRKKFIEQDDQTKKYHLGLNALLLGSLAMNQTNLYQYGLPILNDISKTTGETANMVVRDQWEAIYIFQIESQNSLRVVNHVGSRVPLYCTAAGKVLLAFMDKKLRKIYYKEKTLMPLTPYTLVSKEKLEEEVKTIRKTRIAWDREEQAPGEACLATPVCNYNREGIAAISISFPANRLIPKEMKAFAEMLKEGGMKLSKRLGFFE